MNWKEKLRYDRTRELVQDIFDRGSLEVVEYKALMEFVDYSENCEQRLIDEENPKIS